MKMSTILAAVVAALASFLGSLTHTGQTVWAQQKPSAAEAEAKRKQEERQQFVLQELMPAKAGA
mgnify:CR=1 FL=1